jgi:hypothetical protein
MMKTILSSLSLGLLSTTAAFADIQVLQECKYQQINEEGRILNTTMTIADDFSPATEGLATHIPPKRVLFMQNEEGKASMPVARTITALPGSDDFSMLHNDFFPMVEGIDLEKITSYELYQIEESHEALFLLAFAYTGKTRVAGMGVLGWYPVVCAPHKMIESYE